MLAQRDIPHLRGLISVIGTFRVGPREEAGGRVSSFQLELDDSTSRTFTEAAVTARTAQTAPTAPTAQAR